MTARALVVVLGSDSQAAALRGGGEARVAASAEPAPVPAPMTAAAAVPEAAAAPAAAAQDLPAAPVADWVDGIAVDDEPPPPAPEMAAETATPADAGAAASPPPPATAPAPHAPAAAAGGDGADHGGNAPSSTSTPGGAPAEKYTVSSWRDFEASLDALKHRWGSRAGTASFDIVLTNSAEHERSMRVVVYARNDAISPPRREVWPPAVLGEDFVGPTGALLSGSISRTWRERPDAARGQAVTLGPGGTVTLKASMPLRATSPYDAWKGTDLRPVAFIEYLLWVFDAEGDLVYTKRYECLPPATR